MTFSPMRLFVTSITSWVHLGTMIGAAGHLLLTVMNFTDVWVGAGHTELEAAMVQGIGTVGIGAVHED